MKAGRRRNRRCSSSYPARLPGARPASRWRASALAWRKVRQSPSPVIASTEPEASPTSAMFSVETLFNWRDAVIAPRSWLVAGASLSRSANYGNRSNAWSSRNCGLRENTATQTSCGPTGVT